MCAGWVGAGEFCEVGALSVVGGVHDTPMAIGGCQDPGDAQRFPSIGPSSGDAGGGPAIETSFFAVHDWSGHDVSILITGGLGVGRCLGVLPRAKTSMTSMRPPQQDMRGAMITEISGNVQANMLVLANVTIAVWLIAVMLHLA